jgi:hypothetical protein
LLKSAGGAGGRWVWIYKKANPKAVESNPARFVDLAFLETLSTLLQDERRLLWFQLRLDLAANPQGRSQCNRNELK